MKISGKIIKKEPVRSFTNQAGNESKVMMVIIHEVVADDKEPQSFAVEFWNRWAEEFNYEEGQVISVNVSVMADVRERNGITFFNNKMRGWGPQLV